MDGIASIFSDPYLAREAQVSPYGKQFATSTQQLLAALAADGHPAHVISGYRSPAEQAALVAHPQGNPVAQPGMSFHNYGAAADIVPNGDYASGNADMQRLAPQFGIKSLGAYDPNHVQLAGVTIDQLRGGAPVATGPAPMAGSLGAYANHIAAVENAASAPASSAPASSAAPQVHIHLPAVTALAPPAPVEAPAQASAAPNAATPPAGPQIDWAGMLGSLQAAPQAPTAPSAQQLAQSLSRPQAAPSFNLGAATAPNLLLST
jgi:hypothetical protein